ncbi:MAG: RlpA-like double-psi beta-barrel domain-containing protein [Candidatus Kerfeldbacteria bacterium]
MLVAFGLLGCFGARSVSAAILVKEIKFSELTFQKGFSFTDQFKQFRLLIDGNSFVGPAIVTVERLDTEQLPEMPDLARKSDAFQVTIKDKDGNPLMPLKPLRFEFAVPKPGYIIAVGKLNTDTTTTSWERLGSSVVSDWTRVRSADNKSFFTVALFQHSTIQEGIATYYGTYTSKTKLTMVAASNSFSLGEWLKVTNLDNNASVTVKVVDTGAFRYPTVIDLSTPSFAKIQPTWKGVARVRVEKTEPLSEPVLETEVVTPSPTPSVPKWDGASPPITPAYASIVVDEVTGERLAGKRYTESLPIASLTKLISAAVFMDTKPDLNRVVTYTKADNTTCSCLRLANGEKVSLKDLLFGSLVGSANNATLALVRATGMTRKEFVSKMNAKAASLGLTNTSFTEPTGLDSGNVSSAFDLSLIARTIPDTYPTLKKALSSGSYSFTSKNAICYGSFKTKSGSCKHSFKTTDLLYGKTSYQITSAKTGFIDESRHTFVLRGKNGGGKELVVVLLKVYNKSDSFAYANRLMDWAFAHYTWT